ncbi:hypothetical protein GCM10027569_79300 [Flindersiella endophytica]
MIGLQEVDVHWGARSQCRDTASVLGRKLGMHGFFAPIYSLDPIEPGRPRREFGVALLSKHRILARHGEQQQILVGDFNARPDAPELAPLWDRLQDAWATANGPDGGFGYPATTPDRRIDYVTATRQIRIVSAEVVDTQASDHRPLVTDLLPHPGP